MTCGARSFAAIGQWAGDVDPQVLCAVEHHRSARSRKVHLPAGVRALIDADELDRALGAFWWTRSHQVNGHRVIAIDGKTVRGARTRGRQDADAGAAPHLVAAFDHATRAVVGQAKVDAKSSHYCSPGEMRLRRGPATLLVYSDRAMGREVCHRGY